MVEENFWGQDNLDGLDMHVLGDGTNPNTTIFFSLNNDLVALGDDSTIYVNGGAAPTPWQTGISSLMGLRDGDDVDALVIYDMHQPGVFNPGIDMALFSLRKGSTTLKYGSDNVYGATDLGGADVFLTSFRGTFTMYATAESMGLYFTDEVDALDYQPIPEPCTVGLVGIGLAALVLKMRGGSRREA
jgi:hypothetical protein